MCFFAPQLLSVPSFVFIHEQDVSCWLCQRVQSAREEVHGLLFCLWLSVQPGPWCELSRPTRLWSESGVCYLLPEKSISKVCRLLVTCLVPSLGNPEPAFLN